MSGFNPQWKPGEPIQSPVDSMVTLNPDDLERIDVYKLLIGSVVPRPIGFISTRSVAGINNLAPYSSFNLVSSLPPTLLFTANHRPDGSMKDTLVNIEETGDFVVNIVSEWIGAPMVWTAPEYDKSVDEFSVSGLTAIDSDTVSAPRVKESAIQIECRLYKLVPIGEELGFTTSTVVIGRIKRFHIWKEIFNDGKIDCEKLKPLARVGGFNYATVSQIISMPTPQQPSPNSKE